ncbi:MAG: hypothetical protein ACPGLV_13005 [Bacteroidia bacterium]
MNSELYCSFAEPSGLDIQPNIFRGFAGPNNFIESDPGSKVWCIQKLNAIKQNQHWVLENLMVDLSKQWQSNTVGLIEFIYPANHSFNYTEAQKAQVFCNRIKNKYNKNYNTPFKYYITNNVDDMGLLENFDYYFTGITSGKARENMIITAKGNEYYPHELVHKVIPINKNRGYVIDEGLATYLGTRENKSEYNALMAKLAKDLIENPNEINFESVVSQKTPFNGYQTAYPAGAGICEVIMANSGDKGLIQLINGNTSTYIDLINTVSKITKLTESEIKAEWKIALINYL